MGRRLLFSVMLLGIFLIGPATPVVQACPMCKTANESSEDPRPQAYMYSILFMLAVPASLFAGVGFGLYRINQHERTALGEGEQNERIAS